MEFLMFNCVYAVALPVYLLADVLVVSLFLYIRAEKMTFSELKIC
jgi:hypothetical protein